MGSNVGPIGIPWHKVIFFILIKGFYLAPILIPEGDAGHTDIWTYKQTKDNIVSANISPHCHTFMD